MSLRLRTLWRAVLRRIKTGQWPPKIVFIHVPKCAGTSAKKHIRACTWPQWTKKSVNLNVEPLERNEDYSEMINRCANASFVSGHFSFRTFETFTQGQNVISFTLLRDPKKRLLSLYNYLISLPDGQHIGKRLYTPRDLGNYSAIEFFTSDNEDLRYLRDNFILRQFAGDLEIYPDQDNGPALLEAAKKNLSKVNYVGFQETVATDLPNIVHLLQLPDAPVQHVNKSSPKKQPERQKDLELDEILAPLIRWDQALYDFAWENLRQRDLDTR